MPNYQIVADADVLRRFIDWLPQLEQGEVYYVCLLARKKWAPDAGLKSDKAQLKRFTSDKEWLFKKIKQMECELGLYDYDGVAVPQHAIGVYINVNPRSLRKASIDSVKVLLDLVTREYSGFNPHAEVMSCIQKAYSRKVHLDFDFDGVPLDETLAKLPALINMDAVNVLKTRGGFHLLIESEKVAGWCKKTWYKKLLALPGVDVRGDNFMPIPGCLQGGFVVPGLARVV